MSTKVVLEADRPVAEDVEGKRWPRPGSTPSYPTHSQTCCRDAQNGERCVNDNLCIVVIVEVLGVDSAAVSIFVVILVELTNTVFVNSTNITTNIETAALSNPPTPNEYGQVHAELYSWAFLPCLKRRSTNMNIVQNKTKPVPSWQQVENLEKGNYLVRYNSKAQFNSFCFSICNFGL